MTLPLLFQPKHSRAKRIPLRVNKTRQNKKIETFRDWAEGENALDQNRSPMAATVSGGVGASLR